MPEEADGGYIISPPYTLGGVGATLYSMICPIPSARWAEYQILFISSGDGAGQYSCVISDRDAGLSVLAPYTNAQQYSPDTSAGRGTHFQGFPIRIGPTATLLPNDAWHRITNSEKKVFVFIDTLPGTNVLYVTLRFRMKRIETIPGPSHEVHPDHMHTLNQARHETTKQRLAEMGVPQYAQEGDSEAN